MASFLPECVFTKWIGAVDMVLSYTTIICVFRMVKEVSRMVLSGVFSTICSS